MKKQTVVLGMILTLSLTLVVIGATRRLSRRAPITTQSVAAQKSDAQDMRPLKDKAKGSRNFTELKYPTRGLASSDLAELANRSSDVIIGTPVENISRLSADGRSITLDYQVRVEYVYKGAVKQGKIITVSLPGGKLMFDDGSIAEVQTPWFKKMLNDKTYALFLTPGAGAGKFTTASEAQGVFEIPTTKDSQAVNIHSGIKGDAMLQYQGMNVRTFLKEVRRTTRK